MKRILLIPFFLLPVYLYAQTIHIENGEIAYKGKIHSDISDMKAVKKWMEGNDNKLFRIKDLKQNDSVLTTHASFRLNSPYAVIRTLHYSFIVKPSAAGFKYQLDSVYLVEKHRGGKNKTTPSADIYKDMEESGEKSIKAEVLLNEIDMRIEKIIALMKNEAFIVRKD
jgi:hypothetical protein